MTKTYLPYPDVTLYTGVNAFPGGWVVRERNHPSCLNDLENGLILEPERDKHFLDEINATISDPNAKWYDLDDGDKEYIAGLLKNCGLSDADSAMTADDMTVMVRDWLSANEKVMNNLVIEWDTVGFDCRVGWRMYAYDNVDVYVLTQCNGEVCIYTLGPE